ncbi:MAG: DUF4351 domain-containing protein [Stenomitos rutilans HA7619-LM2]|nr:DUF4351 domain-containing protein [Stenomitos rutilans HA7619-LM2]
MELLSRVKALPLTQLEALTETLLAFTRLSKLLTWLEVSQSSGDGGTTCAAHASRF